MNWADKEMNVIKYFNTMVNKENVFPLCESIEDVDRLLMSLISSNYARLWLDNSSKSAPPPDFLSEELGMMMEMMRIDDHGDEVIGNLINKKESKIHKELVESGILSNFPNLEDVRILANTELDTYEDHNYYKYTMNFKRIVQKHIDKIEKYRQKNSTKELVFFIFDESTAYVELENEFEPKQINELVHVTQKVAPHLFFFDKDFVEIFLNADINYVIWYAPYKLIDTLNGKVNLPTTIIYDLKAKEMIEEKLMYYNPKKMMSSEK